MTHPTNLSVAQQMVIYEQNAETFRSLNQLMWQIPLIAMTLTGGLWFGVSRSDTSPVLQLSLLGLAAVGNGVLIIVLGRLRYIMGEYLRWIEAFYPAGFVAAVGVKWWEKPATVRTMFQFMLGLAAVVSLILMANTAIQAKWFVSESAQSRAVAYYDRNALALADSYEGLAFETAHPELAAALATSSPMRILDVGSGSGRDAAGMAALGHHVKGLEPSSRLRDLARRLHPAARVDWLSDALPGLGTLGDQRFDIILLSAVWMHVEPLQREVAFKRLAELLAPGGRIYMTLRLGPASAERAIYPVSEQELRVLARDRGLALVDLGDRPDLLGRSDVRWRSLVLAAPEAEQAGGERR